eukprot:116423-Amphidinium_carterae.1
MQGENKQEAQAEAQGRRFLAHNEHSQPGAKAEVETRLKGTQSVDQKAKGEDSGQERHSAKRESCGQRQEWLSHSAGSYKGEREQGEF